MKVYLNKKELQAALLFASQDETRFLLNSVRMEQVKDSPLALIATDGRCLAVILSEEVQSDPIQCGAITVPSWFLKDLVKMMILLRKEHVTLKIVAREPGDNKTARLIEATLENLQWRIDEFEGNYPNWRAYVPDQAQATSLKAIAFDSRLISKFQKARELLYPKQGGCINFAMTDPISPIVVTLPHPASNFLGILMPMRGEGEEQGVPASIKKFLAATKP